MCIATAKLFTQDMQNMIILSDIEVSLVITAEEKEMYHW